MPKRIGFISDSGHLIEDVVQLVFEKKSGEQPANSTRYVCKLKAGKFDLYLPNFLVHGKAPKRLQMALRSMD